MSLESALHIEEATAVTHLCELFAEFCRRSGPQNIDLETTALYHATKLRRRLDRMGVAVPPFWTRTTITKET